MSATPTTSARRRGRPRKDEEPVSAEGILAAALHAFAVHGYEGISLRTLNTQLGLSHNAVNQRFGSKAELWRAAVDWGFGGVMEEVTIQDDESADPLVRLRAIIRAFVIANAARPDLLRLVNAEASTRTDRLEYLYANYLGTMETVIRPVADILVEQDRIRPVPWRTLFFLITAGGTAVFSNEALALLIAETDPGSAQEIRTHADVVADIIVDGLSAPTRTSR